MKSDDMNTPPLETDRLILRPFTHQDLDALLAIYGDEDTNIFLPWFPLKTKEEARLLYEEKYEKVYEKPRGYHYAVCLKSDNIPIGYVHVSVDDSHDLGYALRKTAWGKGIIIEACQAVLQQVKKDGYLYVTATHDINNPRSGHVMEKLGMQYQYAYKEDWQPKDLWVTFRLYQLNFDDKKDRVYLKYRDQHPHHFVEAIL